MSLIGLDIGTTGCKAIIFNHQGKILARHSEEYSINTPHPNWAEQDAEQVWQLAIQCLKKTIADVKNDYPEAIALSVQGEAIIPVNQKGQPLRPAILGMDTRTTEQNQWLTEKFGAEELFNRTGMPVHTINTLPKLLWLKKYEPQIWKTADKFLLYEDYFINRFCGSARISHCLASRTQMYDIHTGDWAEDILSRCEIDSNRLAKLAPAEGGIIGQLGSELSRQLGLKNLPAIVSGGHDQACAALGSGVLQSGLAMVSTGTAEVVEIAMKEPALNQKLRDGNISIYRHVVPGLFLAMTLNHSGGLSLRWFRDEFCKKEIENAKNLNVDPYDLILSQASDVPTGLLVLPHFSGSGTPTLDTNSKGAVLGLTFSTKKSDLAKAILEGLTFELRTNLDLLSESGIQIDRLHAVGGGAKSSTWLQIKSDICNVPVNVPLVTEAACLGAAILAGVGIGVFKNYDEAVNKLVKITAAYIPNAERSNIYNYKYNLYKKVYPAVIEVQHNL